MKSIETGILEIAYDEGGPSGGDPVLLLHGWPDAPRSWNAVAARLHAEGKHTFVPALRGFAPTRFRSAETPRVGVAIAMAQDILDFADALGLDRFDVAGHDWGARIVYVLCAIAPERLKRAAAIAVPYAQHGELLVPGFPQARRFWYQWFMSNDRGAAAVRADPIAFAREQWETWSPRGWFEPEEFEATAQAFTSPDFVDITLNSYRSRWRDGEVWDARYDAQRDKVRATGPLSVPMLMLHGEADTCVAASESEGLEGSFTGGYRRLTLDGIGHFPQREFPGAVASALLEHFR